jgi:hypothetical protein
MRPATFALAVAWAAGVGGAACGNSQAPAARLEARVSRLNAETTRFDAPATAVRCGHSKPGGLLLQGSEGGNGVLVWIRSRDSIAAGEFPLLARGDSSSTHGATVAVRFMVGDLAHGLTLDSGGLSLAPAAGVLSASARGSGVEVGGQGRVALEASFTSVPLGSDTVPCQVRP